MGLIEGVALGLPILGAVVFLIIVEWMRDYEDK
jgi:hypothetical protein